ncbi:hypothetical protein [Hymenobacter sp. B81]|uniref:hypothetical protein n=1 Tax=Hymenobacter sp. B81 TaxID=3344878 RepID=UPI0037DDB37C
MRLKVLVGMLLGSVGWAASCPAQAQTRPGSLHTAPGKPLKLQSGNVAPYVPARPPSAPVILPRFWTTKDSTQWALGYRRMYSQLFRRLTYPADALMKANSNGPPSGSLLFRYIIAADGSVQSITLAERRLTLAESAYPPETLQALEQAGKHALGSLRFAPAAQPDTMRLRINFNPEGH